MRKVIDAREYVDYTGAAAVLDGLVTPWTIGQWVREGRVSGVVRVGNKHWLSRAGLAQLIVRLDTPGLVSCGCACHGHA